MSAPSAEANHWTGISFSCATLFHEHSQLSRVTNLKLSMKSTTHRLHVSVTSNASFTTRRCNSSGIIKTTVGLYTFISLSFRSFLNLSALLKCSKLSFELREGDLKLWCAHVLQMPLRSLLQWVLLKYPQHCHWWSTLSPKDLSTADPTDVFKFGLCSELILWVF